MGFDMRAIGLLIPFMPSALVLGYVIWSWASWRRMKPEEKPAGARRVIAVVGSIAGAASASLLIVMRVGPAVVQIHWSPWGRDWVLECALPGGSLALAALVCGIAGAPGFRRPASLSGIMIPIWLLLGGIAALVGM